MHTANTLKSCSYVVMLAVLLAACKPSALFSTASSAVIIPATAAPLASPGDSAAPRHKTGEDPGEVIGPAVDCDGDGVADDARIDFNGDGVAEECEAEGETIPEPPFQQTYLPSSEAFYSQIPAIGWNARYQCGDGLYEITLERPDADQIRYSVDGLTLTSKIVYDDTDPNLNQPLIIQDPTEGLRYTFSQEQNGELYEYAVADYGGNVGLYVYQTGVQIVAVPCQAANTQAAKS
jgi:hypothetical protein